MNYFNNEERIISESRIEREFINNIVEDFVRPEFQHLERDKSILLSLIEKPTSKDFEITRKQLIRKLLLNSEVTILRNARELIYTSVFNNYYNVECGTYVESILFGIARKIGYGSDYVQQILSGK